jgi:hypothetical protein
MVIGEGLLLETDDGLVKVPVAGVKLVFPGVQNLAVTNVDRPLPHDYGQPMGWSSMMTSSIHASRASSG